MKNIKIFAPHPRADGALYANSRMRFLAIVLDLILLALMMQVVIFVLYFIYPAPGLPVAALDKRHMEIELDINDKLLLAKYMIRYLVVNVVQCVLAVVYFVCMWFKFKRTPAKALLCMKLVDDKTLMDPTLIQCVKRAFAAMLSLFPLCLGLLWLGISRKNQTWHDKISGTIVVHTDKSGEIIKSNIGIAQYDEGVMHFIKNVILAYRDFLSKIVIFLKKITKIQ
ncbi:RDD family protein [Candidatus Xenohaliotis californiensis]